jgi:hypothetical protein
MLSRNKDGKLVLKSLDLEIFIGDMFGKCKNQHEIDWLQEQLSSCVECSADERTNEIE